MLSFLVHFHSVLGAGAIKQIIKEVPGRDLSTGNLNKFLLYVDYQEVISFRQVHTN